MRCWVYRMCTCVYGMCLLMSVYVSYNIQHHCGYMNRGLCEISLLDWFCTCIHPHQLFICTEWYSFIFWSKKENNWCPKLGQLFKYLFVNSILIMNVNEEQTFHVGRLCLDMWNEDNMDILFQLQFSRIVWLCFLLKSITLNTHTIHLFQ